MIVPHRAPATASAQPTPPTLPAHARALAARLAALFETDSEIVGRLNDAHHRLANANDRLWGPAPDTHGVHLAIHHAFCEYQSACEQRRQLAVDVGELSVRLTDALTAAGHSPQQARRANVHQLAQGTWPQADNEERKR